MDILIRGYYGKGNFGDDALLVSAIDIIREQYPNSNLYCDVDQSYLTQYSLSKPCLDNYDITFYGGGTQFFSFFEHSFFKKLEYILKKGKLIKVISSKLRKKKPDSSIKVMIGMGLGPFVDPSVERKTKSILENAEVVHVRDDFSLEHCKKWGIQASKYVDLCFYTKRFNAMANRTNKEKDSYDIGFIVRDWEYRETDYLNSLIEAAKELQCSGVSSRFIIFSSKEDKKSRSRLITAGVDFLEWYDDESRFEDFMQELNSHSVFISARFHGAIFASLLNKPFAIISIDRKLDYYAGLFDFDNVIDPDSKKDRVIEVYNHITENRSNYCDAIIQSNNSNFKAAQDSINAIKLAIEKANLS